VAAPLKLQLEILAKGGGATVDELQRVRDKVREVSNSEFGAGLSAQVAKVAELAFQYNNVVSAIQNLVATARPVYELLIGSNERLNAQILSSQTNLASATRVFSGGVEVTDPTAKINASRDSIRLALKQVEIDTQQLVGVTSAEVNELFQITLTNAASLNNQSKAFPDAISAATQLTKGWAASLKVVGVPLVQARQEINSILKGQVDQNSILAKNLNITNDQVNQWRSQGRLVDELNKRLDVFVAGNAIAARSIDGVGSNIKDLIERLARTTGEPLLEPIINGLVAVEKYLKSNEEAITRFFTTLTDQVLKSGGDIGTAFAPLGKTLLQIGEDLGPIALSAIKRLLLVFVDLARVIAPLAELLAGVVGVLVDLAATDLGGVVVQTAAVVIALTQLGTIAAGLAAAALPALSAAVLATVTSLGTLYASALAVATGNTAMALSIPALQTAFRLLTGEAIALNAALIPLTAAIALTVLVKTTNDLKDANDALESYGQQLIGTVEAVRKIAAELDQFNKIRERGGALTDEQIKREKFLQGAATAHKESIRDQIKNLKEFKPANDDQARLRDNNIKQLEIESKILDKATGGIKLQGKELEKLGDIREQLTRKIADAQRLIKSEADGDPVQFSKAAKEIVDLTQKQVQAKQISMESARTQLETIKNNTKVEVETQIAAKEAIDKLYNSRIAKIKELIETSELVADAGLEELGKIRDDLTIEPATRRKAGQQIVGIRKEQIATETAVIATGKAQIELLQTQQRIGEAAADRELTKSKIAEIAKRIEVNKIAQQNATGETERAKLIQEERQLGLERDKLRADIGARSRKRALEDFDERRNLIKAQNDLGRIDEATYNRQILDNDRAQNELAIRQQQTILSELKSTDKEGREAINAQIALLESKKIEIFNAYDRREIDRQNQFYDQELTMLEAAKNAKLLTEKDFGDLRAANRIKQADAEIEINRRAIDRLGSADLEGRNALNAKINALESRKIGLLDQLYQSQLEQIKIAQDRATQLIQSSELERNTLIGRLANRQLTAQEEIDRRKLLSSRQSVTEQLELARQQERELAKLVGKTRSPETERAYQREVQAAQLSTARLTLNLLDNEASEIARVRDLAIKRIEDENAARNRQIDRQLSQIEVVKNARNIAALKQENQANREVALIELTSKALERQNGLEQAKYNFARAIREATAVGSSLEIDKLKQGIELTKQLEAGGLRDKERIIIQQQIAQLVGGNGRSIFDLTRKQQELEAKAAEDKREGLIFEQVQAQAQLSLDQAKNDLALRRQLIESQIAEVKSKQTLLDAQAVRDQDRLNTAKAVGAAREGLDRAQKLAPGRERDRQVADAENRLQVALENGLRTAQNAQQGVDLATQQVDLAERNTRFVVEQQQQQTEINRIQQETLNIQQKSALAQLNSAAQAKQQADQLARARAEAEELSRALGRTQQQPAPTPTAAPVRPQSVSVATPNIPLPTSNPSQEGNDRVVGAINNLKTSIENRNPQINTNVSFAAPDSNQFDEYNKLQRSIARSSV
jgi:hypothetical protein